MTSSAFSSLVLADPNKSSFRNEIARQTDDVRKEIEAVYESGLQGGDRITGIVSHKD